MNENNAWQALRYVVDDPMLDRAAFEERMLSDVDLALAVANAVREIDVVRAAASAAPDINSYAHTWRSDKQPASVITGGWHWSSLAALAAALLLAIGAGLVKLDSQRGAVEPARFAVDSDSPTSGSEQLFVSEHFMAEHWLAMHREALTNDSSDAGDGLLSSEELREITTLGSDHDSEEDDWMLDAAREFYTQGVAG